MKFKAIIENNKIVFNNKESFNNEIRKLNNKEVTLDIIELKKKRSNDQNEFYWAFLKAVSNMTGYSILELHDLFKIKFCLQIKGIPISDEYLKSNLSRDERIALSNILTTTAFNTKEFTEYAKQVREFVLTNGLIQLTEEQYNILETFFE